MNGKNDNDFLRWLPFALSLSKGGFLFLQEAHQKYRGANRIVLKIKWCTFGTEAFLRLCASALKTNMYPFPAG